MISDKISVLVPILNGGAFLDEALLSLERQTFRNFELLVWDNGSTDDTLEILERWIPNRLPGYVFKGNPCSLGISLSKLVEVAQNEFCARMDADDICHPLRFQRQLDFFQKNTHLALVGTDRICIDINGGVVEGASSLPYEPSDILHSTLVGPRIWHPTVMFKRSAVLKAGNYQDHSTIDEPYWSEDYDLWMRLQTSGLAQTMTDQLLMYRINPSGVTQNAIREKRASIARRRVWERSAADFTGLNSTNALRIYDRSVPFLLPFALRISKHFSALDGLSTRRRILRESFLLAIGKFTNGADLVTRFWLRTMQTLCFLESKRVRLIALPKQVQDLQE